MSIIDKILRAGEGRMLRKLDRLASQVDAMQEDFEALTDEELQAKTQEFKDRLEEGETLDDLLADRSAYEDFDTAAAAARDYHYVDLYEKAVQHLIG